MDISETEHKKNHYRQIVPQIIAVFIKNIVLFGFGTAIGFPTILIPNIQQQSNSLNNSSNSTEPLQLDAIQISWISSIHLIFVPFGCLMSGLFTQYFGRKLAMQIVNVPFIVSWFLLYQSNRVEHLYVALALIGLGGGLMEAPVITYVAEVTEARLRGIMAATSSLAVMLGVFMQFLFGTFLYWRSIALCNAAVPITAILLLFIVPESPYWLLMKKRADDARESLAWLRGWVPVSEIRTEFELLQTYLENAESTKSLQSRKEFFLRHYWSRTFLVPYAIVTLGFFLSHFSGMATLQTFSVPIFQTFRSPIDSYYATFILGIFEVIGTIICVIIIHRLGRRRLTFVSTTGSALCFTICAIYAYTNNIYDLHLAPSAQDLTPISPTASSSQLTNWIPFISLIGATLFNHLGLRLLPWVLIGEVFSVETRSNASGIAGGTGYVFGFFANKIFLATVHRIGLANCFAAYALITVVCTAALFIVLPETEGKTLYDIELHFSGLRKLSNRVKPKKQAVAETEKKPVGTVNRAFVSD